MKKIILQSKLGEDQALEKLGIVSKNLLDKGLISKGDELVAGVEEKDGDTLITINADLMTKDNYKNIKSEFLEVGKVITNDLKNFDELPEDSEGTKEPKNEDTHEEQKAVDQNKIKPAEAVLHDTSELLFDINPNRKEMDDFKTLLFSEEEINKAPESKEERPADPKAEEKKPEEKEHDTDGKGDNDGKDPKDQPKDEPKNPEGDEKLHDLLFSDDELNQGLELHDLLFSDDELNPGLELHDLLFSDEELKESHEAPKEPKKECPFHDREEALKALAEYRRKAAEGKELTVAEKFFCDAASKHFSDEEIEKASKEAAKPAEPKDEPKKPEVKEHDDKKCFKVLCPKGTLIKDGFTSEEEAKKYIEENKLEGATVAECKEHDDQPKDEPKDPKDEGKKEEPKETKEEPKEPKKPEEPKREETKMELIRRLNRENSGNTLMGRAKEQLRINK